MKKVRILFVFLMFQSVFSFSRDVVSGFITVDNGKIYYEMTGHGENIVLIHDGLIHHEIWDEQFSVLAKRYRVIRYDRRGYGKSPVPRSPYSNIEDLNRLFVQLKIQKAIVFGMSAGGGLAIDFVLQYPEKVAAMVLVGAVVSGYGYSRHMLTRGGRVDNLAALLSDPQKIITYFGWEDPYQMYPENVQAKERCRKLLETNPQNADFSKNRLLKPAERPAVRYLSEIRVPSLVVVGEHDIPDVHAHAGVIETGITGAKREIIPGAGHLVPMEQPETFNRLVLKFLNSMDFFNVLRTKGVEAAVQYFHRKRKMEPDTVFFEEMEMNVLGYRFLQRGKVADAIKLFRLNTVAYPDSGNVYDSLGEAYLKNGQKELAVKNYQKSLKLNPRNENARKVLKELKE